MTYLREYVTEQMVLWRHAPDWEPQIRKFFADAGRNAVRSFYNDHSGLAGYVFYVESSEGKGRYFKLVTNCDLKFEDGKRILPRQIDVERLERQLSNYEWFSGPFTGRLGYVSASLPDNASYP